MTEILLHLRDQTCISRVLRPWGQDYAEYRVQCILHAELGHAIDELFELSESRHSSTLLLHMLAMSKSSWSVLALNGFPYHASVEFHWKVKISSKGCVRPPLNCSYLLMHHVIHICRKKPDCLEGNRMSKELFEEMDWFTTTTPITAGASHQLQILPCLLHGLQVWHHCSCLHQLHLLCHSQPFIHHHFFISISSTWRLACLTWSWPVLLAA